MAVRWRMRSSGASPFDRSAPLLRPPDARQLLGEASQAPVALVAPGIHRSGFDGLSHGTSGLAHVPAVEEPAAGSEPRHFHESEMSWVEVIDRRGKVAHARGVDEPSSAGELEQPGDGRRMTPFLLAHEPADLDSGIGSQPADQR